MPRGKKTIEVHLTIKMSYKIKGQEGTAGQPGHEAQHPSPPSPPPLLLSVSIPALGQTRSGDTPAG